MCCKTREGNRWEGASCTVMEGTDDLSPGKAPFVRVLAEFERSRVKAQVSRGGGGLESPKERGEGLRGTCRAPPLTVNLDCFL